MNNAQPRKADSLKALYDGQLGALKVLSERSFSTTLQALTLNLAIVAGLIGGKVSLSINGKVIATALLLIFNLLVLIYLASKARAHHREKCKMRLIESALAQEAGVPSIAAGEEPPFWRAFLGGSAMFALSVALACICSVAALWVPLLSP